MDTKNCAIVIFGASGDLAKRKLIPALNILFNKNIIDESNVIIGSGRSEFSKEEFRSRFGETREFSQILYYHQGIDGLKAFINSLGNFKRVIFFFSLPPKAYGPTAKAVVNEGFGEESSIIIEKPFGTDFESAHKLDEELHHYYDESRIFRIDHYLAKEAVQNILVFRFANSIFEPVWNNHYIESIEINSFETLGLEGRAAYFDSSGMMRDMMQNHLMQLLCLITMEPPVSLKPNDIRASKTAILKNMVIEQCFRHQYEGYGQEEGVAPDSNTDTFTEMKLAINNFRWMGTPIYMRAGKAINRKTTEIGIKFKNLPGILFNHNNHLNPNQIIFKIQPEESIILDVSSKVPGSNGNIKSTSMNFYYKEAFEEEIPEAYQKLLHDGLKNDQTLFVSAEETETSWKLFDPFLDAGEVLLYKKGKVPKSAIKSDWIDFEKYS